jgi:hypothetical protein
MIHRPEPPQPCLSERGTWPTRRTLAALGGLAAFLTAAIGLAPAASAALPPPEPSAAPVPPPPPTAAPTHFPLWAIVAMVAVTVVLSVATTLITLSLEHLRQARRTQAAAAETQASTPSPVTTPEAEARQGEVLSSHHYTAGPGMYRAGGH